jgi:hypothetical protein
LGSYLFGKLLILINDKIKDLKKKLVY